MDCGNRLELNYHNEGYSFMSPVVMGVWLWECSRLLFELGGVDGGGEHDDKVNTMTMKRLRLLIAACSPANAVIR